MVVVLLLVRHEFRFQKGKKYNFLIIEVPKKTYYLITSLIAGAR